MNKVGVGSLRHSVTIQDRPFDTVDGQEIGVWTDVCTPFASIEPAVGTALQIAEAMNVSITHTVTIRWRVGITTRMRVLYGTRVLDIVSVIDVDERHFWLELLCNEGLTAG